MNKFVYDFSEGSASMKQLLGGKGANLAEMTTLGIPVPFGFTISTEACALYYDNNKDFPIGLSEQVSDKLKILEEKMNAQFGNPDNPLLVSVRSGAAVSMPGMMDTVLNLGLNPDVVEGLIKKTGNERFVRDSFRRFIQMFGNVVLNIPSAEFEKILEAKKHDLGVSFDTELSANDLKELAVDYLALVEAKTNRAFPFDPREQLDRAIDAVFNSWNNPRAILYRKLNSISGLIGTAVNVQAMVFGNMGDTSGTGVCFTRNPSNGDNTFYGEFLMNAQGEDVVAGIRTPKPLGELNRINSSAYEKLCDVRLKLEQHYKDMQDIEFTIQEGNLFILQTRNGKRTASAAVKIAVDLVNEKLISKEQALLMVDANSLNQLLHPSFDASSLVNSKEITSGLPASPGAAVGQVVFDAELAHQWNEEGKNVILVRTETSPEDLIGMNASKGILTSRGGMTSHAAVVARGMGKCCISGCGELKIFEDKKYFEINGKIFKEGDFISLDGTSGKVYAGKLATSEPELKGDFAELMSWANEFKSLGVRTNADSPKDALVALKFGAEGIGLCRTEHMFFEESRIKAVREMILSSDVKSREKALNKILPFQKQDFLGLFNAMKDKPVTIRLLDPPLHEFLPSDEKEIDELASELNVSSEKIKQRISDLHEVNPMLGHRGCRLGISFPEITRMQTRAIIEAAIESNNPNIVPEIMVPLVGNVNEFLNQKNIIKEVADEIISKCNSKIKYKIGTMIEVPRAALTADAIAEHADFFSFGTNDLTQMTLGFSRDDVGKFIPEYLEKGIFEKDPFQSLDQVGVGQLISMAVEKGKSKNPNLKLGICGEHGGDPSSIEFCNKNNLSYVSCSPFRVPIAILSAAQAKVKSKK